MIGSTWNLVSVISDCIFAKCSYDGHKLLDGIRRVAASSDVGLLANQLPQIIRTCIEVNINY